MSNEATETTDETPTPRCRTCGRARGLCCVPIIPADIGQPSPEWLLIQREGAALIAAVMREAGPAMEAAIDQAIKKGIIR